MSTGSFNVTLDSYNRAVKNWIGGNGKNQDNAYSCTWTRVRGTKSERWSRYPYGYYTFQTYVYTNVPNVNASTLWRGFGNEELVAYSKLADKIRSHSFDAGVALGELPQTLDLIVSNTRKVLTSYRQLRAGRYEDCMRTLGCFTKGRSPKSLSYKDLAGFWLELKYGWEPLMGDVEEACKAVDAHKRNSAVVVRTAKTTKEEKPGDSLGNKAVSTNTVRLKCTFKEAPGTMASLGLTSPFSVAWELMPWSFVVDWFIPVGTYLSNASFFSGFDRKVLVTKFRSNEFHSRIGTIPSPPYDEFRGGGYDYFLMELTRSFALPTLPYPSFNSMSTALSLGHIKNAAALVASQISLSR